MAEGLTIREDRGADTDATNPFVLREGQLHAEAVPLDRIAASVGTPFYCYSATALDDAYHAYARAFTGLPTTICYALKANSNQAVIRGFARLGAGADVVSEGELRRALAAGIPAERIVFAGVGKTAAEMAAGLDAGILQFNVESEQELETLNAVALQRGARAAVALRVNPDVDANTHAKITTGKAENKFGIDIGQAPELYARASELPGIAFEGVAVHIGSQLMTLDPYREAFRRVADLAVQLRRDGVALRRIDLGGGLGIGYGGDAPPAVADYAAIVREEVGGLGCDIVLEPGRRLVGEAGILVTCVLYVKQGRAKRFVVVDGAMNDLIRPTLYDAYHPIGLVRERSEELVGPADIVGPICESGDVIASNRDLPSVEVGELLAIGSAGAYGSVMASTYNSRPLIAEVMVSGDEFAVVRPRQSLEALLATDQIPPWLR